jgi:hypothetical protein
LATSPTTTALSMGTVAVDPHPAATAATMQPNPARCFIGVLTFSPNGHRHGDRHEYQHRHRYRDRHSHGHG